MADTIIIQSLELRTHIGITGEERAEAQRLTVSLKLEPARGFLDLEDRIERTIDYDKVCREIRQLADGRSRNLIETLAEDIARVLLASYPLRAVEVELRKYILPDTEYVAVKIRRCE